MMLHAKTKSVSLTQLATVNLKCHRYIRSLVLLRLVHDIAHLKNNSRTRSARGTWHVSQEHLSPHFNKKKCQRNALTHLARQR